MNAWLVVLLALMALGSCGVVGYDIYNSMPLDPRPLKSVRVQTSATEKPCGMRLVELQKDRQLQFDENCTVNVRGAEGE